MTSPPSPPPGLAPWIYSWHRDLNRWWQEQLLNLETGIPTQNAAPQLQPDYTPAIPPFGTADQVLGMDHSGSILIFKTVAGTSNQVSVAGADGSLTLSLPQNVHTGASPTFAGLLLTGLTASLPLVTDGSKNLASTSYAAFAANFSTGGDLSGAVNNATLAKLQGSTLTIATLASGNFLRFNGSAWVNVALVAADIPSIDASKITTGQLALARGGTNADLSATGGAGQYLKQNTAGGAVTVATIAAADIPTGTSIAGDVTGTLGASKIVHSPVWNSAYSYNQNDIVVASDGDFYLSVVGSNANHDPTADSGTNWVLFYLTANLTLTVQTAGGRFNSLSAGTNPVWTFIQQATIPSNVTLTIQVNDGTYTFSAQQVLGHAFAGRIKILGNTSTPANCVLQFGSGTNGLNCGSLQLVNGFTIDGVNKTAGTSGVIAGSVTGQGGVTFGANITIKNFAIGVNVNNQGLIIFTGAATVNGCSTGVQVVGGLANLGNGFGFTVSSCTTGVSAQRRANVDFGGSGTVSGNTTGITASNGSFCYFVGGTFSSNTTNASPTVNTIANQNSYISN